MSPRDRPPWFNKASEPVLEILNDSRYPLTASTILWNLKQELSDPPGSSALYDSFEPLVSHGFLKRYVYECRGTKLYDITDRGRAYLAGELDIDEIGDDDS